MVSKKRLQPSVSTGKFSLGLSKKGSQQILDSVTDKYNLQSGIVYKAHKISFLAFKLNLFTYDFGGATMFWGRLCFSTLVFLLRLYLGGDYVSGATTF